MRIKKAVIAAAGFGTRMLPQTKAIPKEMLPVVNKPVIQYIVEELVDSGVEDIVIVTGYHKRSIEDHFDSNFELNAWLQRNGKTKLLEEIDKVHNSANYIYLRQKNNGYGNAMPVKYARPIIGDDPFILLWGDIISHSDRTRRAIKAFEKYKAPIVCATLKDEPDDYKKYGYVRGKAVDNSTLKLEGMIEKPGKSGLSTDLAVMNGYILTKEIFDYIDKLKPNSDGEYCLIDAINDMCSHMSCYAVDISDVEQYDTGNKVNYFRSILEFAKKDEELEKELDKFLSERKK